MCYDCKLYVYLCHSGKEDHSYILEQMHRIHHTTCIITCITNDQTQIVHSQIAHTTNTQIAHTTDKQTYK